MAASNTMPLRQRQQRDLLLRLSLALCLWLGAAYGGLFAFTASSVKDSQSLQRVKVIRRAGTTIESKRPVASEWRLNVGRAIDVLRRDVVALFDDSLQPHVPDFSIYSPDIEVQDARLPSFQLRGIASYQQVLSTMQWSVRTTCDRSQLDITSMSPPVNNQLYMRWRLKLWFKDMRSFLAPAFGSPWQVMANNQDGPFIVEGYSRYEFDSWSAEIVKHTIDITNPPTYLSDLVAQYARVPAWPMPVSTGMGVPSATRALPLSFKGLHSDDQAQHSSPLAGATAAGMLGAGGRGSMSRSALGWLPGLPEGCEDDFECNDGKANFPLQCCELPLMGKFCCEPPDDFAQGVPNTPAYVPLPVPVKKAPWEKGSK